MKLYTEEQVRKLLKYLTLSSPSVDGYIDRLIPIELPSDEEIVKQMAIDEQIRLADFLRQAIENGVKLSFKQMNNIVKKYYKRKGMDLKEQILNQNKQTK